MPSAAGRCSDNFAGDFPGGDGCIAQHCPPAACFGRLLRDESFRLVMSAQKLDFCRGQIGRGMGADGSLLSRCLNRKKWPDAD